MSDLVKFVLTVDSDDECPMGDEDIATMAAQSSSAIPYTDTTVHEMGDTMLDHLREAREMADYGSEEKRILTEAWNEIAEHQKETGEWYEND